MEKTALDRIAYATIFVIGISIVSMFVLVGWGFVELIQWITSK
jgi:hypothetical protein